MFHVYIVQLRAPNNNQVALNSSTCIGWPNSEKVAPTELDQSDRKCRQVKIKAKRSPSGSEGDILEWAGEGDQN